MRVLFVDLEHRSRLFRSPSWMPTYFTQAAALLREKGHEVALVETGRLDRQAGYDREECRAAFRLRTREFSPEMILFDGRARILSDLRDMGRAAREEAPGALILAGGRFPTLLPEHVVETNDFLDGAIVGEPEEIMLELAGGRAIEEVSSTAFIRDGKAALNPAGSPLMDLDRLPYPAWDLLDMDYYRARTPRVIPCMILSTATVKASRGCANNCTFCNEGRLHARPVRYHSGPYVAGMFEKLVGDYGVEGVYFCDEMLLADRNRAAAICEELIRTGMARRVKWSAQVRTDAVEPEILKLMRRAGCVQLEFGIESGSQRVLDGICKGTTVEGNAEALAMTRRAGVRTLTYVMFAMPDETLEDLRMTEAFLRRVRPDIVRLIRNIPLPGTPMTKKLIAQGRLKPDFWNGQVRRGNPFGGETVNLTTLKDDELAREARRLYYAAALRPYARDFIRQGGLRRFTEIFEPAEALKFFKRRFIPLAYS